MSTSLIPVIFLTNIHFKLIYPEKFCHFLIQSGFFLFIHLSLIQILFCFIHKMHCHFQQLMINFLIFFFLRRKQNQIIFQCIIHFQCQIDHTFPKNPYIFCITLDFPLRLAGKFINLILKLLQIPVFIKIFFHHSVYEIIFFTHLSNLKKINPEQQCMALFFLSEPTDLFCLFQIMHFIADMPTIRHTKPGIGKIFS